MYFRFMGQQQGIPTISNRLYLKLSKIAKYRQVLMVYTGNTDIYDRFRSHTGMILLT